MKLVNKVVANRQFDQVHERRHTQVTDVVFRRGLPSYRLLFTSSPRSRDEVHEQLFRLFVKTRVTL